jgi:outer membrane immunogenic protein
MGQKGGLVMKKFLLGSVGLAAMLAGPAMAADMPVAPPPPPVVYYDWSGAYIGGNVGGIWSTVDQTFRNPLGLGPGPGSQNNFSTSPSNGIFGFHAGAQWQWGAWVLGVEAALSGCFEECRTLSGRVTNPANTFFEHKITNLFTVGPRIGYAWDRWMIFATGGWASANLKSAACNTVTGLCDGPNSNFNGASRNDGWYVGGGFDYMVHKGSLVDVILGVEYQHYDVGSQNAFCLSPFGCNVQTAWDYDLAAKGDIVRARLTIKSQGYGWWYR